MRYNLLNTCGLYKEGEELCIVRVIEQREDEQGLWLKLKVDENKYAKENDEGDLEYYQKLNHNDEFTVSGSWEIVSINDGILHISYVGVRINFRKHAIESFAKNEIDFLEMWHRKE